MTKPLDEAVGSSLPQPHRRPREAGGEEEGGPLPVTEKDERASERTAGSG
jgi:hypothetical protein